MKKQKKYTNKDLAQAHVFPHGLTETGKEEADKQIWEIRKNRLEDMDAGKTLLSQLMRLKFKMSQYIASSNYEELYTFSYFLKEYVASLNKTKHAFSKEISLHNSQLSRLLHNKEEPNKNILIRLEIHSNKSIPALFWFKILEKQKELELMKDTKLRESEKVFVKKTVQFMTKR